jgi:hypothetical protein
LARARGRVELEGHYVLTVTIAESYGQIWRTGHAASGDLLLEYTTPGNVGIQHIYLHGKRVASKRIQF